MMPPADRIREQNEQDPGRVAHTRQEAGFTDFLAVGPTLCILQLNVDGLSAAKRSTRDIAERHNVDVISLQETHVDADRARPFFYYRISSHRHLITPDMVLRCIRKKWR